MKSPLSEISIAISPGLGSIKGFQTIAFPWSSYRKKTGSEELMAIFGHEKEQNSND